MYKLTENKKTKTAAILEKNETKAHAKLSNLSNAGHLRGQEQTFLCIWTSQTAKRVTFIEFIGATLLLEGKK